jgi:hypothetical protein
MSNVYCYDEFNCFDVRVDREAINQMLYVGASALTGVWVAVALVAFMLEVYKHKQRLILDEMSSGSDADVTSSDGEFDDEGPTTLTQNEEINAFVELYFDELQELALQQQHDEISDFKDLTIVTPVGEVLIRYLPDEKVFLYFSDVAAKLTYAILDTCARYYAITVKNASICIHAKQEYASAYAAQEMAQLMALEKEKDMVPLKKSIYAQFKKNKPLLAQGSVNAGSVNQVTRRNIFRQGGKLSDALNKASKMVVAANSHMDYATYKKLMLSTANN